MRFLRSTSLTTRLMAVATLVILVAGTTATALTLSSGIAGASLPGPPTPTPGTVEPGIDHDGLARDAESFFKTAEAEGRMTRLAGTETAGSSIEIAGTTVRLPEDAYVKQRAVSGQCDDPKNCPALPVFQIVRGNSSIWVGSDGLMVDEELFDGEEDAFDFLREALR